MGNTLGKKMHNYLYTYAALIAVGMLGACNEPTTFVPTATEQFVYDNRDYYQQASKLLQADYLIVPDTSYSMNVSKAGLESALYDFASYLQNEDIDYRVGFARGTTQSNGLALQHLPTNFIGSILTPTSGISTQSQIANGIADMGVPNAPNVPVILETAKRVIESQYSNFVRQGSQLVYVFISDADDRSHDLSGVAGGGTTSHYADVLASQKSHPDHISARAFVTTGNNTSCPLLGSANYGYKAGTRLLSVASSLDAGGDSFRCLGDYDNLAASLENLANDVSKPTRRFAVQANAEPSSIVVRVNGSVVNPGINTWTFKSNTNEVVFKNAAKPADNATVEITFDMIMKLNRLPKLSSMVVTINGSQVPQSNGSGWSLDTNTLELKFHGGWQPNNGDTILVSYEVQ